MIWKTKSIKQAVRPTAFNIADKYEETEVTEFNQNNLSYFTVINISKGYFR